MKDFLLWLYKNYQSTSEEDIKKYIENQNVPHSSRR